MRGGAGESRWQGTLEMFCFLDKASSYHKCLLCDKSLNSILFFFFACALYSILNNIKYMHKRAQILNFLFITQRGSGPQERHVRSLSQEDPLEEEMATHSCLKNPMNRGARRATIRGVTESD